MTRDVRATVADIESLLDALERSGASPAAEQARALVAAVTRLHGAGLQRIVRALGDEAPTVLERLRHDEVVAGLLELHDLADPHGGAEVSAPSSVPVRITAKVPRRPGSSCELCRAPLAEGHDHVVDVRARSLLCSCRPCYLLFTPGGAGGGHYRAVPSRYLELADPGFDAALWESLQVPVGVAFFFQNSELGRVVASYPGPAGATESRLPLDAWEAVLGALPEVAEMEPDVEALLVRLRERDGGPQCAIVPIDACYELVGRLRRTWRGFDGGQEARAAVDGIFSRASAGAHR